MENKAGQGETMTKEVVLYEKENRLGIISINRPEVRNALNTAVFSELDKILDRVAGDEQIRALVIKGVGKGLDAGADVNELLEPTMVGGWAASRFQQSVFTKLERIGKPSIAAITGFCLGGGLELALSCSFRVASTTARIGFPEMSLGIIPGFGGTERAVRTVGYAKALELLLCSSLLDGQEAYRIGLIHQAVEPDEVLPRAKELGNSLARLNPVAMRLQLELLLQGQGSTIDQGLSLESALGALVISSKEAKELLSAFLQKASGK
jgi:enoyl-CoA hydratase